MMRSEARRFGARFRPRFRIRTWCRINTDSATTERIPPGRASRITVTINMKKKDENVAHGGMVSNLKSPAIQATEEFAMHRPIISFAFLACAKRG